MNFLTAQYRAKGENTISMVVQHYEVAGEHICFACISKQDSWSEGLYLWFREMVFGKNRLEKSNCIKRMERSLQKKLNELEKIGRSDEGENLSVAFVFCIGQEFLAFERGEMRILLFNTAFGKSHLEYLQENEEEQTYSYGCLEKDVAFLLAGGMFCEAVGRDLLQEVIFVGEAKEEWQMEKRLRELAIESGQEHSTEMGAILLRSCMEKYENIQKNNFRGPVDGFQGKGQPIKRKSIFEDLRWGKKLGQGAFSQVIKVQDMQTGKMYACKESKDIPMLWREYCVGGSLIHPLFPKMYDFWQENNCGYLLMEYVPGENVKRMLERRGAFSVHQTIRIGMELAKGVLYLHERKIPMVFRDIKPENIVIRQDGRVKLLDLGCVCNIDISVKSKAGTPGFAAPEQFVDGKVLDVTCDVYALARTMEEMLGEKIGECKRLKMLLEMCTEEDSRRRIPDMRLFVNLLGQLAENNRKDVKLLYKRKILCHKNIWWKNGENV